MTEARRFGGAVVFAFFAVGVACHKSPLVEFPRPPATASVPESQAPPAPQETPAPTESSPPPEAPTPSPPAARPQLDPPSPATPSPPPSRASRSGPGKEDPLAIQDRIHRTESILETVSGRSLGREGRDQVVAARTFVLQAKDALVSGEVKRAAVLADKAYILAQDVERSSR